MNCPFCNYNDSKVIDSRETSDGIRRRRQCLSCGSRFTTYERLQLVNLFVIKKDKRREEFDRNKLLTGIRKACEKRPLPDGTANRLADSIETELYQMGKPEIPSSIIGNLVMEKLRDIDQIAYIRFASVYRKFEDIDTLRQEIDSLLNSKLKPSHPANQLPLIPEELPAPLTRRHHRSKQ